MFTVMLKSLRHVSKILGSDFRGQLYLMTSSLLLTMFADDREKWREGYMSVRGYLICNRLPYLMYM